jgi:hypothetical protein
MITRARNHLVIFLKEKKLRGIIRGDLITADRRTGRLRVIGALKPITEPSRTADTYS